MAKRTLLLINGSQILMDITRRILERDGYSVRCALGFSGAREQLLDRVPDGILLAKELPDGDGIDCLRELVTERGIPVLFLSDRQEDELAALKLGAFDFLKKPYDFEVLKARVRIMLDGSRGDAGESGGDGEDGEYGEYGECGTDGGGVDGTADRAARPASAGGNRNADVSPSARATDGTSAATERQTDAGGHQHGGRRLKFAAAARIYRPAVTAACFALAAAMAWVLLPGLGGGPGASDGITGRLDINLYDAPIPAGPATEPSAGAGSVVIIPEARSATVPAGSADADISLSNPAGNRCHMQFEIELRETREIVYASGALAPGASTGTVTLSRAPEAGGHAAVLVIRMYAPEDLAPIGVARMDFTITVG